MFGNWHPCIKKMDRLLNQNILYRPLNHNTLGQMLASSSSDNHNKSGSRSVSYEAFLPHYGKPHPVQFLPLKHVPYELEEVQ